MSVPPPAAHPRTAYVTCDQRRNCQLLHSVSWKYTQIQEPTGFALRQIGYVCSPARACPATPTKRPGHPPILTQAQIEDLVAYVCMSAGNRRLSFQQLAEEWDFGVGKKAIRAALLKEGFHQRLAMKKPLISARNQAIRLQ